MDDIKIYVADLSDYNNGILYGEWFDLSQYSDATDLTDAVVEMLKASPRNASDTTDGYGEHEEWAIHDFDADSKLGIGEYTSFNDLMEMQELVENEDSEIIMAYMDVMGCSVSEAIADAMDKYYGEFENDEDLATEYAEAMGLFDGAQETLEAYFNFEAFGRDLAYDFMQSGSYYFSNN